MDNHSKTYDVVILTHKPGDELILSIEMLWKQTIKPNNIIIINTDKEDFTQNITKKYNLKLLLENKNIILKHIVKSKFDHGKTRNYAATFSKTNYILYLTDDAIPYNVNLAQNLIFAFSEYDKVAVSYARQIPKKDASIKEKLVREFNYPNFDIVKDKDSEVKLGIKNYFCSNVCAMYKRSIFDKLEGFEENIILNEDTFYVYKAINNGYKVVYKRDALVLHSHNLTNEQQFKRNFDIGVSQKQHREIFDNINSTKEGSKLFRYAFVYLIKNKKFKEAWDFIIECLYRYSGFKSGYRFDELTFDDCLKHATNIEYFIKNKKKLGFDEKGD